MHTTPKRPREYHYFRVTITYTDGETSGNRVFKDRAKAERWAERQKKSPVVKKVVMDLLVPTPRRSKTHRLGGISFYSVSLFKWKDSPGFGVGTGDGQMTTFMHETEHLVGVPANQIDPTNDHPDNTALNNQEINDNCAPQRIETIDSPLPDTLTPP